MFTDDPRYPTYRTDALWSDECRDEPAALVPGEAGLSARSESEHGVPAFFADLTVPAKLTRGWIEQP